MIYITVEEEGFAYYAIFLYEQHIVLKSNDFNDFKNEVKRCCDFAHVIQHGDMQCI